MRKKLKHAFIPHKDNGYKPGIFEYASISAILVAGIVFFMFSLAANRYLVRTGQGAAVYASVLVELTNQARAENNEPPLVISEKLTKAAEAKADDMASKQYFSHTSPNGTTPWYWFQRAGYDFLYAGENLAVDFTESADVEKAWLASPKHRENIIDSRFTEIGIATKTAFWQGRETTFVVQLFGTPADLPSAPVQKSSAANGDLKDSFEEGLFSLETKTEPQVEGIKVAQAAGAPDDSIRVIAETPSSIVAENSALSVPAPTEENSGLKPTLLGKTIVRVPHISNIALMALSGMVLLSLLLFVFVEIRRQHPKQVLLGIFALVALSSLAYVSHAFTLPLV